MKFMILLRLIFKILAAEAKKENWKGYKDLSVGESNNNVQ